MKLQVKSQANKALRKVEVPDEVFSYPYNEHLIHQAVVSYRNAQRSGTHSAKNRNQVVGSGRKLYRQKGTGRARVGPAASPIRRGGGAAHGPRPRSYKDKLSVREKKNALRSALSRKLAEEKLFVIENFELESHRTQDFLATLDALGVDGKALIVDNYHNEKLGLASRNLAQVKAVDALGVNVYDVVDREHVLISEEALGRLVGVLHKEAS